MNGNLISNSTFGKRIYMLRDKAGYNTHRELALVICGYPQTVKGLMGEEAKQVDRMRRNIQNWEVGKNIPNAQTIAMLCNLLDCDPDYLLYENASYPRREVKATADSIGLTNKAVETLMKFTQPLSDGNYSFLKIGNIISTMLENPNFYQLTDSVMQNIVYCAALSYNENKRILIPSHLKDSYDQELSELKDTVDKIREKIETTGYTIIGIDNMIKMLEFETNQSMGNLIKETIDVLQEEVNEHLKAQAYKIKAVSQSKGKI